VKEEIKETAKDLTKDLLSELLETVKDGIPGSLSELRYTKDGEDYLQCYCERCGYWYNTETKGK
jgi:hypothetical protein